MKLFGDFEAVKFQEENLIFITHNKYLYYIYDPKNNICKKYYNAGNDEISVEKYQDLTREELSSLMNGNLPKSESDLRKLCGLSEMYIDEIMDLMKEDYSCYISNKSIYNSIRKLLIEADIRHMTYWKILQLLEEAKNNKEDTEYVLTKIKELCFAIVGRDIFKQEIEIVDGHDSSSYFWIMPVRVIDYSDTNYWDNVAEMRRVEISIEEDNIDQYLRPFLEKYFDDELKANKKRVDSRWEDDDGTEHESYVKGFEWYLTHNFYSFESIESMLKDILDTIDALATGKENEFTAVLRVKRGMATYPLLYSRCLTEEQIKEYNADRPSVDNTATDILIDFYHRFIYRMEFMLKIGKEKGYDLISFMGP